MKRTYTQEERELVFDLWKRGAGLSAKKGIRRKKYRTRAEARTAIFEYIEMFYNPKRCHTHNEQIRVIATIQVEQLRRRLQDRDLNLEISEAALDNLGEVDVDVDVDVEGGGRSHAARQHCHSITK